MQSEEIFLDMFEDEYRELVKRPINVEFVMSDASLLLPPTGTGILTVNFHLAGMVQYLPMYRKWRTQDFFSRMWGGGGE